MNGLSVHLGRVTNAIRPAVQRNRFYEAPIKSVSVSLETLPRAPIAQSVLQRRVSCPRLRASRSTTRAALRLGHGKPRKQSHCRPDNERNREVRCFAAELGIERGRQLKLVCIALDARNPTRNSINGSPPSRKITITASEGSRVSSLRVDTPNDRPGVCASPRTGLVRRRERGSRASAGRLATKFSRGCGRASRVS